MKSYRSTSPYLPGLDGARGLILPRHMGEAQWLIWDDAPGDKILVSANRSGFTSLIVRNGDPVLVRTFVCEPESIADELHRFAMYYRDRRLTNRSDEPTDADSGAGRD